MTLRTAILIALAATSLLAGACTSPRSQPIAASTPVLFDGMGSHHRTVTTDSPEAQRWFDQGLVWACAFNHDEAIRSFEQAVAIDPDCAMAWWGIALSHGPHINNPMMDDTRSAAAWDALQKAVALKEGAAPVEQDLIGALEKRYAWPAPADRAPLDVAYADAMREVRCAWPNDADVATLYAEAMMDLRPWDLWTLDGAAQPGTPEIVATLESALTLDPNHPGANHLYIHAVEASPEPARACVAADRLRTLVPASGHLVHMPSHIDVRVGAWKQAADANERAIEVDIAYRAQSPKQGFYHVYMAHNLHFLAFTAMMEGRRDVAMTSARAMVDGVPAEFIDSAAPMVDPYMTIVYDVQKRFGMWDELIAEPAPDARLPITIAMWRFSRGVAFAAKGMLDEATREQEIFREACAKVPADALMVVSPAHDVLAVADAMLAGEIAYHQGDIDAAVRDLRKSVALEDRLRYMEPPEWIQPVRHALGAVLVSAGRFEEAEPVYREDLRRWPENGWSLLGLRECLVKLDRDDEAAAVAGRLANAWSRSEVSPKASCACVVATGGGGFPG